MDVKLARKKYDWARIEEVLGYTIPTTYKECYEYMGAFGIDDYLYVNSMFENNTEEGFDNYQDYVKYAYSVLEKHLDEKERFNIGIKVTDWFPIGQTSNGDFMFCNDSYGVMITDSGFEEREVYECSLLNFIYKYLKDEVSYRVIPDGLKGVVHEVDFGEKELGYLVS